MWICAFHLLIFYGFSSKLLEPQFKLDDLRNHFCNSEPTKKRGRKELEKNVSEVEPKNKRARNIKSKGAI